MLLYHYIRMNGLLPVTTSSRDSRQHNGTAGTAGQDAQHLIGLLRTLADPIRLRMVRLLECTSQPHGGGGGEGGVSVGELGEILKLPQSTVSRHLKTLGAAGLAEARREGTSTFYRLSEAWGGVGQNASRQLRLLIKSHLEHDPAARNDAHRLAAILRKREPAADSFFGKHAQQWDQLRAQWFGEIAARC